MRNKPLHIVSLTCLSWVAGIMAYLVYYYTYISMLFTALGSLNPNCQAILP